MMPNNIERSPGLIAHVGVLSFIVGGGCHGATETLDSIVDDAAIALTALFDNHPVTIRFNSDRQSGGAWLKTAEIDGFGSNCEIEIGANLSRLTDMRGRFDKWPEDHEGQTFAEYCRDHDVNADGAEEQVNCVTYIKRDYLRDPSLATDGEGDDAKSYQRHATLAEAIEFVRAHAVADPRIVTLARKRRAAALLRATVTATRAALAPLTKAELTAVAWRIPYQYRPHGFGFKNPKENKAQITEMILSAVRARAYTFEPAHTASRF